MRLAFQRRELELGLFELCERLLQTAAMILRISLDGLSLAPPAAPILAGGRPRRPCTARGARHACCSRVFAASSSPSVWLRRGQERFQPLFVVADLTIEAGQIVLQPAQLALLRNGRRFAPQRTDRQRAVGVDQLALQRDEAAAAARVGRQLEGRFERVHHPRVAQQLLRQRGGLFGRTEHRIGAALHAAARTQVGQGRRIELETFEKSADRPFGVRDLPSSPRISAADDEPDTAGNRDRGMVQILDQRLEVIDHDGLGAASQRNFRKCRLFQVDIEQLGDASQHAVPRRRAGRSRTAQDFLHADAESLLAAFEIFQDALAGPPGAALFAAFRQGFCGTGRERRTF